LIVDDDEGPEDDGSAEEQKVTEDAAAPAEPEQPAEPPEAQAEQPKAQAEQQLGRGHLWRPDANDLAAAQGLVAHQQHRLGNCAIELLDMHRQLSARALDCECQIEEEV